MVRKDGSYVKKKRLEEISQEIARSFNNGEADLEKVLVWIQYNIGLTYTKALEYARLVCDAKGWIIRENKIVSAPR